MSSKLTFKLLHLSEILEVDASTKLHTILHKKKYKQEIARKMNIDDVEQIKFKAYYECNRDFRNMNINENSSIKEFVSNSGVIVVDITGVQDIQNIKEDTNKKCLIVIAKNNQLNLLNEQAKQVISKMQVEHRNEIEEIKKMHKGFIDELDQKYQSQLNEIRDFITESDQKHKSQLNEMNKKYTSNLEEKEKEIEGYEAVFKLSGYISILRKRLIKYINDKYHKKYSDWKELTDNEEHLDDEFNEYFATCGNQIEPDDWQNLKKLARNLNEIKHGWIEPEDAEEYLKLVQYTNYRRYESALRHLVEYFKQNK